MLPVVTPNISTSADQSAPAAAILQVEEFEHQQKELESVCNPIITRMYQAAGGAGGMPGGMPDLGGMGGAGAGGASSGRGGPTVEEVD